MAKTKPAINTVDDLVALKATTLASVQVVETFFRPSPHRAWNLEHGELATQARELTQFRIEREEDAWDEEDDHTPKELDVVLAETPSSRFAAITRAVTKAAETERFR